MDSIIGQLLGVSSTLETGASDQLAELLQRCTQMLGTDIGIISRVEGDVYTVLFVAQPADVLAPGQQFELAKTYCAITLDSDDVVTISDMASSDHSGHPCYTTFGLETYVGVPLIVDGEVFGTLNFSSPEPRGSVWTERERELIRLFGQWVSRALSHGMLIRRMDSLGERLAVREQEMDRFNAVVAHDLKQPLRQVRAFLDLLEKELGTDLSDQGQVFASFIRTGMDQMQSSVDDLLEYSQASGVPLKIAKVNTGALVAEVLEEFTLTLAEYGGSIVVEDLPDVQADGPILRRVFSNLIGNALKYRGVEAPIVRVWSEFRPSVHWFAVQDNGIGIEPKYRARIFEMFQRLHSQTQFDGNGVGLATCKRVVARHGGEIGIEDAPDGGCRFWFTLPRYSGAGPR